MSFEDDQDLIGDLAEENLLLKRTLQLPLIFYRVGPWTDEHKREWAEIAGTDECTTKVMCDTIRKVLEV